MKKFSAFFVRIKNSIRKKERLTDDEVNADLQMIADQNSGYEPPNWEDILGAHRHHYHRLKRRKCMNLRKHK